MHKVNPLLCKPKTVILSYFILATGVPGTGQHTPFPDRDMPSHNVKQWQKTHSFCVQVSDILTTQLLQGEMDRYNKVEGG